MILLLLGKVEKMILTIGRKPPQKTQFPSLFPFFLNPSFFKIRRSVVQASLNLTIYKQPMVAFSHLQSVGTYIPPSAKLHP